MSRVKTTFNLDSDKLLDLLMESAGAETYKALADFLEVSQQSVSNARANKRIPEAWIIRVSQKKNIPIETIIKKKEAPSEEKEAQKFQVIRIPYGVSGTGSGKGEYGVMLNIAQDWVDKSFPCAQRPHLIGWVVEGDNLAPEIPVNTFILIDTSQTNIMSSGIFAFQVENSLALRRLHLRLDGRIDVVNDNGAYPSSNMTPAEIFSNQAMKVIGKVIFKGLKIA